MDYVELKDRGYETKPRPRGETYRNRQDKVIPSTPPDHLQNISKKIDLLHERLVKYSHVPHTRNFIKLRENSFCIIILFIIIVILTNILQYVMMMEYIC